MSQDPYLQQCPYCGRTIAAIAYKCPFCDRATPQKELQDATAKARAAQAGNPNALIIVTTIVMLLLVIFIISFTHSCISYEKKLDREVEREMKQGR
jgi:uncharacterized membrane protein YvbJ